MLYNLKKLREEAGVTQRTLAEAIEVSQQSINKYENHNIEPDIATLIRIADFFGTSVDYLIGHSDIRHKIEIVQPFELTQDELWFVCQFRNLNNRQKNSIYSIVENYLDIK